MKRKPAPAKQRKTFIGVDMCPVHGFAMLSVYTVDEKGTGGGTRLLGPKSCCGSRREAAKWPIDDAAFRRLIDDLESELRAIQKAREIAALEAAGQQRMFGT